MLLFHGALIYFRFISQLYGLIVFVAFSLPLLRDRLSFMKYWDWYCQDLLGAPLIWTAKSLLVKH